MTRPTNPVVDAVAEREAAKMAVMRVIYGSLHDKSVAMSFPAIVSFDHAVEAAIRHRQSADAALVEALEAMEGVRALLDLIANGLWEDCPYPEVMKNRITAFEAAIAKATGK